MTENDRKLKISQIQKMLGEKYGTVGRSENWDAAESIVKLFDIPDVSGSFSADKIKEAYTDGFSDSRYDFDTENYR